MKLEFRDQSRIAKLKTPELIDEFGQTSLALSLLETKHKQLREEIIRRGVEDGTRGKRFLLNLVAFSRWTLDAERIKTEMGEAWCTARSKVSQATRIVAKAIITANDVIRRTDQAPQTKPGVSHVNRSLR